MAASVGSRGTSVLGRAQNGLSGEGASIRERTEKGIFATIGLMADQDTMGSVSSWNTAAEVLAIFIDVVQLMGILLSTEEFYWPSAWLEVSRSIFRAVDLVVPAQALGIAFAVALGIVWVTLVLMAFSVYSFAVGELKAIWPIRVLRVFARSLLSVLFIPTLDLLTRGVARPEIIVGDSGGRVAIAVLSTITCVLFVPFALMLSALDFDNDPLSRSIVARPSGRTSLLDTVARILIVVLTASKFPAWFSATAFFLVMAYSTFRVSYDLPYYRQWVNTLRSSLYAIVAWVALGAVVLFAANPATDAERVALAVPWMAVLVVPALLGWLGPGLRATVLLHQAHHLLEFLQHARRWESQHEKAIRFQGEPVSRVTQFSVESPGGGRESDDTGAGALSRLSSSGPLVSSVHYSPRVGPAGADKARPLSAGSGAGSAAEGTDPSRLSGVGGSAGAVGVGSASAAALALSVRVPGEGKESGDTDEDIPAQAQRVSSGDYFDTSDAVPLVHVAADDTFVGDGMSPHRGSTGTGGTGGGGGGGDGGSSLGRSTSVGEDKVSRSISHKGRKGRRASAVTSPKPKPAIKTRRDQRVLLRPPSFKFAADAVVEDTEEDFFFTDREVELEARLLLRGPDISAALRAQVNDDPEAGVPLPRTWGEWFHQTWHWCKPLLPWTYDELGQVRSYRMTSAERAQLRQQRAARLNNALEAFAAGQKSFATSYVALCYATFLEAHSPDEQRATRALRIAERARPELEVRFQLFQRAKLAERHQHASHLGEHRLGTVGMIEMRKLMDEAGRRHRKVIQRLHAFWADVERKNGEFGDSDSVRLSKRLAGIHALIEGASDAYKKILAKFPRATALLRNYGDFLLHVLNQKAQAEAYFARAEEIEEEESKVVAHGRSGSVASYDRQSRGTGTNTGSGASGTGKDLFGAAIMADGVMVHVKNDDLSAVKSIRTAVLRGLLLLAALVIASTAVVLVRLDELSSMMDLTWFMAGRRTAVATSLYYTRSAQLAATSGNATLFQAAQRNLETSVEKLNIAHDIASNTDIEPIELYAIDSKRSIASILRRDQSLSRPWASEIAASYADYRVNGSHYARRRLQEQEIPHKQPETGAVGLRGGRRLVEIARTRYYQFLEDLRRPEDLRFYFTVDRDPEEDVFEARETFGLTYDRPAMGSMDVTSLALSSFRRINAMDQEALADPDAYWVDPDWRFVMDNVMTIVAPAALRTMRMMEDQVMVSVLFDLDEATVFFAFMVAIVSGIAICGVVPAVRRTLRTKVTMGDVVTAVPPGVARRLRRRFQRLKLMDEGLEDKAMDYEDSDGESVSGEAGGRLSVHSPGPQGQQPGMDPPPLSPLSSPIPGPGGVPLTARAGPGKKAGGGQGRSAEDTTSPGPTSDEGSSSSSSSSSDSGSGSDSDGSQSEGEDGKAVAALKREIRRDRRKAKEKRRQKERRRRRERARRAKAAAVYEKESMDDGMAGGELADGDGGNSSRRHRRRRRATYLRPMGRFERAWIWCKVAGYCATKDEARSAGISGDAVQVVNLARRVIIVLLAIVGFQTWMYIQTSETLVSVGASVLEITASRERAALVMESLILGREALIADGDMFGYETLVNKTLDTTAELTILQDALRYGDDVIGLGGTHSGGLSRQDVLNGGALDAGGISLERRVWGTAPLSFNATTPIPSNTTASQFLLSNDEVTAVQEWTALSEEEFTQTLENDGFAVLIPRITATARLAASDMESGTLVPLGPMAARTWSSADASFLNTVFENTMEDALRYSSEGFYEEVLGNIGAETTARWLLMMGNLLLLAVVYLVGLRRSIAGLIASASMVHNFLTLLPKDVIQTEEMSRFFRTELYDDEDTAAAS